MKDYKEEPSEPNSTLIQLDNFHYNHGKTGRIDGNDRFFIGREKIINKMVSLLKDTHQGSGSYLVSGYRGVGKTSVVEQAIEEYKIYPEWRSYSNCNRAMHLLHILFRWFIYHLVIKFPTKAMVIRINLGHNARLQPTDIFYSITNLLYQNIRDCFGFWQNAALIISSGVLIISTLLLVITLNTELAKAGNCTNTLFCMTYYIGGCFEPHLPILYAVSGLSSLVPFLRYRVYKTIISDLKDLNLRTSYVVTKTTQYTGKIHNSGFNSNKKYQSTPLTVREIEAALEKTLIKFRTSLFLKTDIIFLFDEIDKLSGKGQNRSNSHRDSEPSLPEQSYETDKNRDDHRKKQIEFLLGTIKNFITTAAARSFFITGRDTLDSYYAERGSTNSLYESMFDHVFEIPSLLSDDSDDKPDQISSMIEVYICRLLMNPTDAEECYRNNNGFGDSEPNRYLPYTLHNYYHYLMMPNKMSNKNHTETAQTIVTLRNFINFATFHSWGNPKRLASIFDMFVITRQPEKDIKHYLRFKLEHNMSFMLASDIFTLFQHQLSREVLKINDKITISVLSSLQFILKLHRYGFTRESLHRMADAINIHRSPMLNAIVDDILDHVLRSYMRRVRNGMYRYRFNSGFEQELRQISNVDYFESASYTFSLDAMSQVKQHFLQDLQPPDKQNPCNVSVKANITLGDMNAIEQSYNKAAGHYSTAVSCLRNVLFNNQDEVIIAHVPDTESILLYVEAMLKYSDLEEHRQNYSKSIALYLQIEKYVHDLIEKSLCIRAAMLSGDSKWDTLRQPYWALKFISLKKSPQISINPPFPYYLYKQDDQRFHFRQGELYYYQGEFASAINSFRNTLACISDHRNCHNSHKNDYRYRERYAYTSGYALVNMAECILIRKSLLITKIPNKSTTSNTSNCNPQFDDYKNIVNNRLLKHIKYFASNLGITKPPNNFQDSTKISKSYDNNPMWMLKVAATQFEQASLYGHAAFAYIKLISYWSMMIDNFSKKGFSGNDVLLRHLDAEIDRYAQYALKNIDLARQVESSQFMKTTQLRDIPIAEQRPDTTYQDIFDILKKGKNFCSQNPLLWQHSILGQKLLANYLWWKGVNYKLGGNHHPPIYPENITPFSIRFYIQSRWERARCRARETLALLIDADCTNLTLAGKSFADNSMEKPVEETVIQTWADLYDISHLLHSVSRDIRLISRNNLDLVFPLMSQVYFLQWKILYAIFSTFFLTNKYEKFEYNVRNISKHIQDKLLSQFNPKKHDSNTAPSYFDFEHITIKSLYHLNDVINLADSTSRIRTSILQQKYFFHDDHSDAEFHMDWTLTHMFIPKAIGLKKYIEEKMQELNNSQPTI